MLFRVIGGALLTTAPFLAGCAGVAPDAVASRAPDAATSANTRVSTDNGFTISDSAMVDSDARADFDKAVGLLRQERLEEGIALLNKVAERAPQATAPYLNLAIAYDKTGKTQLAEDSLRKALAISPDHPLVNNEYGLLYRKTGRFQDARKAYERALEKFPAYLPARKNLAILCDLYLGDMDCARKHYQIYSVALPDDKNVRTWIADVEARQTR